MKLARLPGCVVLEVGIALSFVGCTGNNPDQIRQKTAQATETMRHDAKAVAEGVKEGITSDKTVNINKASRDELLKLPGLTGIEADRIVAERPFHDTHELVRRRILSNNEYDKVKDRIIAGQ